MYLILEKKNMSGKNKIRAGHLGRAKITRPGIQTFPSLAPPLVSDDGVVGRVDHRGVVDGGEVTVHQVKFVHAQQGWPDGFDLDVGKVLPDATVPAWWERPQQQL